MLSSPTLTIMRGLPGSGKSHLAHALANIPGVSPAPVFSTDDFLDGFFINMNVRHGLYFWGFLKESTI